MMIGQWESQRGKYLLTSKMNARFLLILSTFLILPVRFDSFQQHRLQNTFVRKTNDCLPSEKLTCNDGFEFGVSLLGTKHSADEGQK